MVELEQDRTEQRSAIVIYSLGPRPDAELQQASRRRLPFDGDRGRGADVRGRGAGAGSHRCRRGKPSLAKDRPTGIAVHGGFSLVYI